MNDERWLEWEQLCLSGWQLSIESYGFDEFFCRANYSPHSARSSHPTGKQVFHCALTAERAFQLVYREITGIQTWSNT